MTYVLSLIAVIIAVPATVFGILGISVCAYRLSRKDTKGSSRITAKNILIVSSAFTIIGGYTIVAVIGKLVTGTL